MELGTAVFLSSILVAIPYVPAYLNLLAAGRGVRDRFYPRLLPALPITKSGTSTEEGWTSCSSFSCG